MWWRIVGDWNFIVFGDNWLCWVVDFNILKIGKWGGIVYRNYVFIGGEVGVWRTVFCSSVGC